MTIQSVHKEWEDEKGLQSRIEAYISTLPPHQLKRLESERNNLNIALARVFGDRIAQIAVNKIVRDFAIFPECLGTVGGGLRELPDPEDRGGWNALATQLVNQQPLAKLSIEASDSQLKAKLADEVRSNMRPADKANMAHAGTLDSHVEKIVNAKLQERAGL